MPGLQTILGKLNHAFSSDEIGGMAVNRDVFAPGRPFASGLVMRAGMPLYEPWISYLDHIPATMQVAIQSILYQALGTVPPTQVVFAWAPGYDYELTIWHAPDTPTTRGGITILIKSRYPDDTHPLQKKGKSGS